MGAKKSIPVQDDREKWSPVLRDMVKKYGLESLDCFDDWKKLGFPEQGSLNVKKLLELDSQLKTAERKMKQKKKIKTCKLKKCDLHRRVFSLWMEEAQFRLRKSEMEELPNTDSLMEETKPIPHNPAYVSSSIYSRNSSLHLQAPQMNTDYRATMPASHAMPASQPVSPVQPTSQNVTALPAPTLSIWNLN